MKGDAKREKVIDVSKDRRRGMMKRITSYFHNKVDDYKKKDDKVKDELKRYVQYSKILETDDSLGIPE